MKDAQLQIGKLTSEKKELENQIATLTAELTVVRGNKMSRKTKTSTLAYDDKLREMGKKFCVVNELWVDTSVFSIPRNEDPEDDAEESYNQKIIAALYQCIPPTYHNDMEHLPEFARAVSLWSFVTLVLN